MEREGRGPVKLWEARAFSRCGRTGCTIRTTLIVNTAGIVAEHIEMSTGEDILPTVRDEDYYWQRRPFYEDR